ncbi:membrane protein insertase YidC [Jatrophihabitans sp.]|uniref:membrane protein insertase YidC n=1 Tax=Jatrophihabitans sp. TaxID=1932789 RepID=UPI002B58CAEC|nr:membrane protein insertase YidC [Jatrophihabitans sp.]
MLDFLYTAVSWVLLRWYQLFTLLGMNEESGLTWALSIIMLVVTARLLLFRFFVKQVHYQRRMQEMQPKIKKLQEKHKGDKATLQREMMALQQAEGFNPISGCLPMLLQIPIFISLFHVLKHISNSVGLPTGARGLTLYGFTEKQTTDAAHAKLFNAPLAASLRESSEKILQLGGHVSTTRTVTLVLVLVSALATFLTQRAVIANQTTPPEGQAAMIQRLMLVGIPISVVVSGFIFPLGVLLYWFTSNLWTLGQQYYIFRFHPHTPVAATAGAGGSTPAPPGKTLAPKVGQKPVNPKGSRPGVAPRPPVAEGMPGSPNGTSPNGASSNGNGPNVNLSKTGRAAGEPAGSAGATPAGSATGGPSTGGSAAGNRGQRPAANRPNNSKRSPSKKRR